MTNKTKSKFATLFLLGFITFIVTSWTLRNNFYFLFDDIAWIKEVKFSFDVKNFFTILPISRYNDRPLRTVWFWCLYQVFGMNYTAYYLIVLLWHVLDTYLIYFLMKKILLQCNYQDYFWKSIIVAFFFGIYPKNLMAVYWLAGAANDLLCTFFCLLAMLCYLKYMEERNRWHIMVLSLVFYIFAMRSKEAAICFPIIILLYELYISVIVNRKKFKLNWGCISLLLYMVMYLVRLFTLPVGLTNAGQYKQDFSILTIIKILLNYIRMYFAWDDGSFSYDINNYYTKVGNIGIVICFLIIIIVISGLIRKDGRKRENWGIMLLFIVCGLAMAPLLVLPNIQHMLYFYFPSVFLSMLFGISLYEGITYLYNYKFSPQIILVMTVVFLVILNNIGGAKIIRENFIRWGEEAKSTVEDIESIEKIPTGTHVYLYGADSGANVFNYAPGYIINIIYEDSSIVTNLITGEELSVLEEISEETDVNIREQYSAPYVIWKYADGHVREIGRVID